MTSPWDTHKVKCFACCKCCRDGPCDLSARWTEATWGKAESRRSHASRKKTVSSPLFPSRSGGPSEAGSASGGPLDWIVPSGSLDYLLPGTGGQSLVTPSGVSGGAHQSLDFRGSRERSGSRAPSRASRDRSVPPTRGTGQLVPVPDLISPGNSQPPPVTGHLAPDKDLTSFGTGQPSPGTGGLHRAPVITGHHRVR